MKRFVLLFVLTVAGVSNATLIGIYNVNAKSWDTYGSDIKINVPLSAGIYDFTLIHPGMDSRAIYYSWCPWKSEPWKKWRTSYAIQGNDTIYYGGIWDSDYWGNSAGEGFSNTPINLRTSRIELTQAQTVSLFISDQPGYYHDNTGGVSVMISKVPEPATLALLGLGGMLLRKRKQ